MKVKITETRIYEYDDRFVLAKSDEWGVNRSIYKDDDEYLRESFFELLNVAGDEDHLGEGLIRLVESDSEMELRAV